MFLARGGTKNFPLLDSRKIFNHKINLMIIQ